MLVLKTNGDIDLTQKDDGAIYAKPKKSNLQFANIVSLSKDHTNEMKKESVAKTTLSSCSTRASFKT